MTRMTLIEQLRRSYRLPVRTSTTVIDRRPAWSGLSASPTPLYDGFQSPAAAPASGRVSPESHDAIATISAWS